MPVPHLPDDVFSEIFSQVAQQEDEVASPPPPPKARSLSYGMYKASPTPPTSPPNPFLSLLIVSKRIHQLVFPFVWRTVTISRPSHFISLFSIQDGILHSKGDQGDHLRRCIKSLSITREAVVPFSVEKIEETFEKEGGFDWDGDYDLLVDLAPVHLPNLHHLSLDEIPFSWSGGPCERPGHAHLLQRIIDGEVNWSRQHHSDPRYQDDETVPSSDEELVYSAQFLAGEGSHEKLFRNLQSREWDLVRRLLLSSASQLRTLDLLLYRELWNVESFFEGQVAPFEPRIPSSIKEAKDLVVTVYFTSCNGSALHSAYALTEQMPLGAQIRVEAQTEREREMFRSRWSSAWGFWEECEDYDG